MRKIYIQIGYERMISEISTERVLEIARLPDHHAEMFFFENMFKH